MADGPPRDVLDPDLLTRVYRHPIDVVAGPRGALLVVADSAPLPFPFPGELP
ncbi:hypothetical protein [Microbacterium proteolyticum]|uniref:hypothetical protein n=1 Tax=Microbacterium proteolyticum TaxID=1572644 RepID=UPI0024333DBC|nr:hypothetical protein [Microbacterium proteolyticum]MCI9859434.1 hypothetical protein [Microbacterium proteolyticum]